MCDSGFGASRSLPNPTEPHKIKAFPSKSRGITVHLQLRQWSSAGVVSRFGCLTSFFLKNAAYTYVWPAARLPLAYLMCKSLFSPFITAKVVKSCSWLLNAYKFMAVTLEKDRRAVMGLSSLSFWTHFCCNALVSSIAELPDVFNNTLVRSLCKSGKH